MSQERQPRIGGYKLIELVRQHMPADFDPDDFLLAGSARLWAGGYIPQLSDLDLLARPGSSTWHRMQELAFVHGPLFGSAPLRVSEHTGDKIAILYGGVIEACDTWVLTDRSTDELIDSAEVLGGIRYLSLSEVKAYKRHLDRPKDRLDLQSLLSRPSVSHSPGGFGT